MSKRIIILTTGQPSTDPRMIKEYLSLKEEGYEVKVFYCFWHKWAVDADRHLFKTGEINGRDFILTGGSPFSKKHIYYFSRILFKIINPICSLFNFKSQYSLSRSTWFLEMAAKKEKADLYIAHNLGALPAAVTSAKKFVAMVGFDAEDYHRGELEDHESEEFKKVKWIEDKYIPDCSYVSAASPLIAHAYRRLYPLQNMVVINNVFSKKYLQKRGSEENSSLTLFWFSQTIGPDRGLETVVKALDILKEKCEIELHLMGNVASGYDVELLKNTTQPHAVHFISPVSPDKVFEYSSRFDIGLSSEVPHSENRNFCLTNKLFTYLLSGNCILLSNTQAQQDFLNKYPSIGYLYDHDNVNDLANILLHLHNNRNDLQAAKLRSQQLALECLNWEKESEKFKMLIKEQLN